jgi:hypothetical protein
LTNLEPEQVTSKGGVERYVDIAIDPEGEVGDSIGELNIGLEIVY